MNYETMTIESLAHDCFIRSGYAINEQDLISRITHLCETHVKQGQSLPIDSVIVPKGTLLFHLKSLTKQIEDSHCYGFEDILEDYIKSNAL